MARPWSELFRATLILAALVTPAAAGEIRLAFNLADDVYLAPVYAAEKLGYYSAAGVEIKRLNLRGEETIQQALRSRQADIIDATAPMVARAFPRGEGGRIVATAANGFYGWTVIAKEDSGVVSAAALAGRKLGVSTTHPLADIASQLVTDRFRTQVEMISLGSAAIIPDLRAGKIDAALTSSLLGLREVAGARARILLDLGADPRPYLVSAYVASTELMDSRPHDLRAFIGATFRALVHMKGDRKWSIDLIKEYARISDNAFAERLHDSVIAAMPLDPAADPVSFQDALDLAARAWSQPELARIDIAPLYTNEYIPDPSVQSAQ